MHRISSTWDWTRSVSDSGWGRSPLELGLAAGTLAVKVSTPHDAYCRVATSLDQVPGQLMLGDEVDLNYISTRDAGFRITWDPDAGIVGVENTSWGDLKALFR